MKVCEIGLLLIAVAVAVFLTKWESLESELEKFFVNINERGDPIALLITKGRLYPNRFYLLNKIIDRNERVTSSPLTAIHYASIHKEHQIINLLIQKGYQPDSVVSSNGRIAGATPLHFTLSSSMQQAISIARELLRGEGGSYSNFNIAEGRKLSSKLNYLYSENRNASVVEMKDVVDAVNDWNYFFITSSKLITKKSIYATEDSLQRTAAHFAALSGNTAIIDEMIKYDSENKLLKIKDRLGHTIAHYLSMKKHEEYKKYDLGLKDMLGRSASQVFDISKLRSNQKRQIKNLNTWNPEHIHINGDCDIDSVDGIPSPDRFFGDYLSVGKPLLMRGAALNWDIRKHWKKSTILKRNSNFMVEAGSIPYAGLFGLESEKIEIGKFIKNNMSGGDDAHRSYVFHTFGSPEEGLTAQVPNPPKFLMGIPPALLRSSPGEPPYKGQFYLGANGTGAPEHVHSDAWNGLVYGAKSWWLSPPQHSHFSLEVPSADYKIRKGQLYCQQLEGDILYVPADWGHSTRNDATAVGVAVEFRFARNFL